MVDKLVSLKDHYIKISPFSKRSLSVYNEEMMGVKVAFTELTNEYGLHSHPHTQLTLVVKGKFAFVREGEEIIVEEGDSLLFLPNVEHGCIPLEAPSELFDVFVPIRLEFLGSE